ncbi:MAG: response regulator [Gemmatimonadaceae bacterium]
MAHELRTPLTAIIGMAELLRDSQLSEDQRDMLDIMGRSAKSLVEIVNGVLDLAKLEAGKMQLDVRSFGPAECAEECVNLLAATAAQKRVDLAFYIDESVPLRVRGDAARLRQALINLLGNALKFTEGGQVVLTVTCAERKDDRCVLRFAVADSGPGIPADRLSAIFEPYAQAEVSTSRKFGGTGLGLPITKQLITLMGGRLWVESEVGEGSTFHISLPVEIDARSGSRSSRSDDALMGRRILVIEDNPIVGNLLVAALERWGVAATVVSDLARAMEQLRTNEFDLALIDGEMAGVAGRSVASTLRSYPGGSRLPLVLMTSLGIQPAEKDGARDRREGRFAAYVTKPVRPARLREALIRVFDGEARAKTPVSAPVIAPGIAPALAPALAPAFAPAFAPALAPALSSLLTCASNEGADDVLGTDDSLIAATDSRPRSRVRGLEGIRVLVVDDDLSVRRTLERLLVRDGADVSSIEDGAEAMTAALAWNPDTILLDATLPGMDGFEVCRRLKADPRTVLIPVLMITGLDSRQDRLRALEAGADGFMPKPFDIHELLVRVQTAARTKLVTDRLERPEEILVAMARCIEGKDENTLGHCERLADYGARLGARLGMSSEDVEALRLAGLVHDIGKLAIPDAILKKPGKLDEYEWEIMRTHSVEGEQICSGLASFERVLPIIRHHHEKLDGSGYPDQLVGDAIPATARVLQIIDVYDALTTARPYKVAESPENALRIMEREVERGWWDPVIFETFRSLVAEDLGLRRGARPQVH